MSFQIVSACLNVTSGLWYYFRVNVLTVTAQPMTLLVQEGGSSGSLADWLPSYPITQTSAPPHTDRVVLDPPINPESQRPKSTSTYLFSLKRLLKTASAKYLKTIPYKTMDVYTIYRVYVLHGTTERSDNLDLSSVVVVRLNPFNESTYRMKR